MVALHVGPRLRKIVWCLVGCKIFVQNCLLSLPLLYTFCKNGNELQFFQPPLFSVHTQVRAKEKLQHFYDRVKNPEFVFRSDWHESHLLEDLVIMFTYLWRLVLICGPFPVVLEQSPISSSSLFEERWTGGSSAKNWLAPGECQLSLIPIAFELLQTQDTPNIITGRPVAVAQLEWQVLILINAKKILSPLPING